MQLQATALLEHDLATGQPGVRMYRPHDEPRVLEILKTSLRRWAVCPDPVALWRWKHLANPFGPSCVLVHETADGEIAGVVALMFWRLRQSGRVLNCERTTDLATSPAHRRRGVASSFWKPARQKLVEARIGLVFHTPNQYSLGFTRHSDRPVFVMRPRVGVRNPARVALACARLGRGHGPDDSTDLSAVFRRTPTPVAALFNDRESLAELLTHDTVRRGHRLQTARSVEYLHWRYAAHPTITYYAVCSEVGGRLDGCLIFRLDRFGSARRIVVQELLVRQPGYGATRALRQELDAMVDFDVLQYHDAEGGPWSDLLTDYELPTWNAFNFTVGVYDYSLGHVPLELENWSLTLGDLQEI